MGFASQETIDRVTRVMEQNGYQAMMAVLKETPICPPNDSGQNLNVIVQTGSTNSPGGRQLAANPQTDPWHKHKIQDLEDMAGFIKFGAFGKGDFMGALTFDVSTARNLPTTGSRAGWIPCWYLPWGSGKIYKIKIPDVTNTPVLNFGPGIDPMPNPRLFFTAAINGCSVFAVGNARNPSLYHGGFDPGQLTSPTNPNETTEEAWRRLLGRVGTVKDVRSVGKSDYISQLDHTVVGDTRTRDDQRVRAGGGLTGVKTTALAEQFEQMLMNNNQLTNVSVNPWGAVFGLRDDAGDWHIVLVKNCQVNYHRFYAQVIKHRRILPDKVIPSRTVGEMMPAVVPKQVGSAGLVDLNAVAIQAKGEVIIRKSCNVGYYEFFPGGGQVHNKTLTNINIY